MPRCSRFLAFFTKAASAFFVAAVGLDALLRIAFAADRSDRQTRAAITTVIAPGRLRSRRAAAVRRAELDGIPVL